jgi:hypothetical protein
VFTSAAAAHDEGCKECCCNGSTSCSHYDADQCTCAEPTATAAIAATSATAASCLTSCLSCCDCLGCGSRYDGRCRPTFLDLWLPLLGLHGARAWGGACYAGLLLPWCAGIRWRAGCCKGQQEQATLQWWQGLCSMVTSCGTLARTALV